MLGCAFDVIENISNRRYQRFVVPPSEPEQAEDAEEPQNEEEQEEKEIKVHLFSIYNNYTFDV